jgi:hypothetical protein
MNNNLTEIVFIVDMSGSMETVKKDVIGGFDSFIKSQKELTGECKVTLTMFDTVLETPISGIGIQEVKSLKDYGYAPRGMTALNDAIGKTVNDVGTRLANTLEEERPSKVIVVIQTDGEENASKEYTTEKVLEINKHQQEKYGWEYIFLGANIDAKKVGASYGVDLGRSIDFAFNERGVRNVYTTVSSMVKDSRLAKSED